LRTIRRYVLCIPNQEYNVIGLLIGWVRPCANTPNLLMLRPVPSCGA
jgi:hypothetical protein